jgi:hypothetical protein
MIDLAIQLSGLLLSGKWQPLLFQFAFVAPFLASNSSLLGHPRAIHRSMILRTQRGDEPTRTQAGTLALDASLNQLRRLMRHIRAQSAADNSAFSFIDSTLFCFLPVSFRFLYSKIVLFRTKH